MNVRALAATALLLAGSFVSAQSLMISGYQDSDTTRQLRLASQQTVTATFLIQGTDTPLGNLTVSHHALLSGTQDGQWLQNSDAGFQARLSLSGNSFSSEVVGAPAQPDAAAALQSLLSVAAAQGYTTIPNGSTLKFIHTLNISALPKSSKSAVQLTDAYTLQDGALGIGGNASSVGILTLKTPAPTKAPAAPLKKPAPAPNKK